MTPKGATAYGLANAESAAESAALAIAEAQSSILADAYNDCQYADAILIVEAYAEVLVQAYSSAMGAVAASDGELHVYVLYLLSGKHSNMTYCMQARRHVSFVPGHDPTPKSCCACCGHRICSFCCSC